MKSKRLARKLAGLSLGMLVLPVAVLTVTGLAGTTRAQAQGLPIVPLGDGLGVIVTADPVSGFSMNNLVFGGPDGTVLVDTFPVMEGMDGQALYFYLSTMAHIISQGNPVTAVVNTHWHFDHAGLNSYFKTLEQTETILAHWRAASYMNEEHCIPEIGMCTLPYPPEAFPTQGIRGEKRLSLNGEKVTLKTVENAHSGADLVVYLEKANVVYTGDIYFGGMYPIIDRNSGGTVNGMLHAVRQLLAFINADTIVVPSHGQIGNRQSVLEFARMLETAKLRVRRLIAVGLTESQVIAAQPLADFEAEWGHGFVPGPVFTMIVYRDLAPRGKPAADF